MTVGTNYLTDVSLVGDARLGLRAVADAVDRRLDARPADAVDGKAVAQRARAAKR